MREYWKVLKNEDKIKVIPKRWWSLKDRKKAKILQKIINKIWGEKLDKLYTEAVLNHILFCKPIDIEEILKSVDDFIKTGQEKM